MEYSSKTLEYPDSLKIVSKNQEQIVEEFMPIVDEFEKIFNEYVKDEDYPEIKEKAI